MKEINTNSNDNMINNMFKAHAMMKTHKECLFDRRRCDAVVCFEMNSTYFKYFM